MTRIVLISALLSLRSVLPAHSQTYPFRLYTSAEGLVQSTVSCIFQDSRGYMWFGTSGGISRYDGREFWSYHNSSCNVLSIAEDDSGGLWIGTTIGLATLARGDSSVRWVRASDGTIPSDEVHAVVVDRHNNMWIGTSNGMVVTRPSGKPLGFSTDNGLPDNFIRSIWETSDGSMLILARSGIVRCRLQDDMLVDKHRLFEGLGVQSMVVLRNGDILASLASERIVARYSNGKWIPLWSLDSFGPGNAIQTFGEDVLGNLWLGTPAGLAIIENGVPTLISSSLPSQFITSILCDREGTMWFGTEGGVLKLSSTTFRNYSQATGLPGDIVISVFQDWNGGHWFGTYAGAARLDSRGGLKTLALKHGLPHSSVHAFVNVDNRTIWIGTHGGLSVFREGKLSSSPIPELRQSRVVSLLRDGDGTVWVGCDRKIIHATFQGEMLSVLSEKDGFPDGDGSALFRSSDRTLWFGTDRGGGGFIRNGTLTLLDQSDGLPDGWVMSIGEDRHGTVWFTTQRGAVFWNGKRFEPMRTSEEPLINGVVTFAVRDSSGHLWFGTQSGVYEWDDSVLNHLDSYDGLAADAARSGFVDSEGNVWIGTVGGVSRLDMRSYRRELSPPEVLIEGLVLEDELPSITRVSLAYQENTLTLHFNSLSFIDERRMQFQWTMSGFDRGWQAPHTDRQVRYTHLPWGEYEFVVHARNHRGAWSSPQRLAFVIHPPVWAAWWFIMLCVAGVLSGVFLVYRNRIRGLEKERNAQRRFSLQLIESQEVERKRIAGELHDSLVQSLLIVKNRALVGQRKSSEPEQAAKEFAEITSVASSAIEEVREIAHNLRPYQIDRLGLSRALRSLLDKMNESSTTKFLAQIENVDPLFGPEMSMTLYRIVQESVTNVLKHANASEASILVRKKPSTVEVTVRDNGSGFRIEKVKRGFGLSGIEQRVSMLGGTVTIDSSPNVGTMLHVVVPIRKDGQ